MALMMIMQCCCKKVIGRIAQTQNILTEMAQSLNIVTEMAQSLQRLLKKLKRSG